MIADLFAIIAPVFVCAAIGYGWVRSGMPFDTAFTIALTSNIAFPCLIVGTLARLNVSPEAFWQMVGAGFATAAATGAVAAGLLAVTRQKQSVYLPSLVFGNTGNVGLPLCLFAFGEAGLALGIIFFTIYLVLQFTVGIRIVSGQASVRLLLRTPLLWAALAGIGLQFVGVRLPLWIDNTIGLIGDLAIPLMLLTLGVSLARMKVTSIGRSVAMAVGRLVIGLGVGLSVAALFGLDDVARGVAILESTMPVGVLNYLFAARYATRPEEVAGLVLVSTALSFATMPLLLRLVL